MENTGGVYVMRVASMLCGMHPQTLRKYERAGFLTPARSRKARMYSDEDIARLRLVKHLVDDLGLNLAGVGLALGVRTTVLEMKRGLATAAGERTEKRLAELVGRLLEILGVEPPAEAGEGR